MPALILHGGNMPFEGSGQRAAALLPNSETHVIAGACCLCWELVVRVGVPLLDDYLEFPGRVRPNSVLVARYDVVMFFRFVVKEPREVARADVLAFITSQRSSGSVTAR